jgi:K+-sensing histidine kinase KdpD
MADQRRDYEHRPSPEALLEAARREDGRVGKLRIFVGAAPGVGKTYEMLQQARARKTDGYDVIIGVVETHGRRETEALLEGLEIVPRRRLEYRGQWFEEMDLDAIIARRPQIVIVDELAHTNVEGSRHPKRYLDVEELLGRGTDVYTTVNIQHIESLNDVVAQITHVRVRETVPDAVFDRADAVELVDLTPDDLIQRLKEGKVYFPKQAERALEHFFSPANLTALRELALRRTAAKRLFLPMRTGRGAIGVVGIDSDKPGPLLTPDQRRLLDALRDQGALAIERVKLVEEMDRVERAAETERLRSALLTSISHDLKTPLAAVLGAAGTLRNFGQKLGDAEKADLLATIIDESERLNRFIANLLDMTKLESGAVTPNLTLYDIGEIVGSALRRVNRILSRHHVQLELAPDLPMVELDAVLFEQTLFNLLDNAAKYAPPETTIRIQDWRSSDSVYLRVLDEGSGIPPTDLEHIFDKFYRAQKTDQVRAGTGLGLAISRGFVEAMHGTLVAANRTDRSGAAFTISLPIPREGQRLDAAA